MSAADDSSETAYAAESNTSLIVGVVAAFHALAFLTSGLQLYTRGFLVKNFRKEDYVVAVSTLCAFVCMILLVFLGYHGVGKHFTTISASDQVVRGQLDFILTLLANAGVCLLKISIALSLLALIATSGAWLSRVIWVLIVFVVAYTLLALLTNILYCQPIEGAWDPSVGARCYSIDLVIDFALMNSSCSIFSDVVLAVIPVPIIWNLQMARKLRLYLIGILSLGYFAVAMCATKVYYQFNWESEVADSTFHYHIQFFFLLEFNIGIIAACAPSLKPLMSRALSLSTTPRKGSNLYIDPSHVADSKRWRGYMMQASQDDGGDFELRRIATPRESEHTVTTMAVQGGQFGESKERVVTGKGSYDFVVATGNEAESQAEGIRVTRVTKVSVS